MKKLILALVLSPLLSIAQKQIPRYQNDTLYTTSGFKMYKGQTLQFGKGTRPDGKFRYVNIKSETTSAALANNTIVIKKMKNFGISILGNAYIQIIGTFTFKDGSNGYIDIHMAFDRAIENSLNLPSELIVPDEFRNKAVMSVADELKKLNKLFLDGILTKEEYEVEKKKLLQKQ